MAGHDDIIQRLASIETDIKWICSKFGDMQCRAHEERIKAAHERIDGFVWFRRLLIGSLITFVLGSFGFAAKVFLFK